MAQLILRTTPAARIPVYDWMPIDGATPGNIYGVGLVVVDLEDYTPAEGGCLLEAALQNANRAPYILPGASKSVVLKAAVSDISPAELGVSPSLPGKTQAALDLTAEAAAQTSLAGAVAKTLTCPVINDVAAGSLRVYRSGVFLPSGRYLYIWHETTDLEIDAGIELKVTLVQGLAVPEFYGTVTSVATKSGDVTLELADISDAGSAAAQDVEAFVAAAAVGTAAAEDVEAFAPAFVTAPAAANSPGTIGQVAFDADYIYRCIDTDTWKRAALSTWPV